MAHKFFATSPIETYRFLCLPLKLDFVTVWPVESSANSALPVYRPRSLKNANFHFMSFCMITLGTQSPYCEETHIAPGETQLDGSTNLPARWMSCFGSSPCSFHSNCLSLFLMKQKLASPMEHCLNCKPTWKINECGCFQWVLFFFGGGRGGYYTAITRNIHIFSPLHISIMKRESFW